MKVRFDFSTGDLAEVASRTVNRSPLVLRWRLRNTASGAFLAGLLAFAMAPGDMPVRIAAGSVVALVVFAVVRYLLSRPGGNARTEATRVQSRVGVTAG